MLLVYFKYQNLYKSDLSLLWMSEGEKKREVDDASIIVKVTGKTSKTITIPDTVCEFLGIDFGDIVKLNIKDIKRGKKK